MVTYTVLHFAAVVTPDSDPAQRAAVLSVLNVGSPHRLDGKYHPVEDSRFGKPE